MYFNNDADLYRVIGANIKHYREQVKLTQVQLAEQAKISISYLSKLPDVIRAFLYLYSIRLQMYLVLK